MDQSNPKLHGGHAGTNMESASAHNRRVLLQSVRLYGPVSRPELARISGLTLPTVSTITTELISRGLIRKSGRRKGKRGQPATELSLDPDGGLTFGVSIGADHIVTVLVDLAGDVRGRIEHSIQHPDLDTAYELIADSALSLTRDHAQDPARILGLGMAVPGRFAADRSTLIPPPYLESWSSANIPAELGKASGLRVWVENDANAAALGESYYGAGRKVSNFLYIYIDYGVGAGLIIDRELYLGEYGNAGAISLVQFADQNVPPEQTKRPYGGETGTLYQQLRDQGLSIGGPADLEPLFRQGNPDVLNWIEESAAMQVTSITAAQCLLDPQVIMFGGRIPAPLLRSLVEKIAAKMPPWLASAGHKANLMHATSGIDAAALGAAILPFYHEVVPRRETLLKRNPEASAGRPAHL